MKSCFASNKIKLVLALTALGNCMTGLKAQQLADNRLSETPVFIKNEGQWDDESLFHFSQGHFRAVFLKDRIQYGLARLKNPEAAENLGKLSTVAQEPENPEYIVQVWEIKYNAANAFLYEATKPQESNIGYLNQNTGGRILYPQLFAGLSIKNLYPGVDAEFKIDEAGKLKIDYRCASSTHAGMINFSITGFDKTYLNSTGSICMQSRYGVVTDSIPASFSGDGFTKPVPVAYRQIQPNTFGLNIEKNAADINSPLLIDPFYLDYSTYFYGNQVSGWTYVYDVEVDENNNSYVTGYTTDKYPGTPGTYDTTLNGSADGFLGKIPSSGGKPIYVIYLGGSNTEYSYSLAATNKGDCFVTGYSYSSDYPTTNGVIETTRPSSTSYTSFVTGIKSDGKSLIYSTYLKGYNWVIDVNETGQVYIAPYGDNPYPITRNINPPGQVGGGFEANVIRLNASGSAILDCVELTGSGTEYVYGLSVDKKNQVYAAGWTNSDNLPVTYGQKNFGGVYMGGSYDGFLFKIDSAFTKYLIAKYIGTKGYDYLSGITVNDDEEIFIQGIAGANDLPAATNGFPGGSSAFIMRIYKNGAFPRWTTYITTNTYAWRQRLTISAKDEAVFGGTTWSTTLPVTSDAFQKTNKGGADGYAGKIGIDGSIKYLTYFGGSGTDYLFAVQAKRIGCVSHLIMGGYCGSNNFPLKNEWKSTPRGGFFWTGAVIKWRDTLKVDPIDLGPDVLNCDRNYRIIEAGNPGASYRWQNGDTFSYFIVQKPGKYWVTATYGCGSKSDTIIFKIAPSAKPWMPKDSLICNRFGALLDARNDTIKGIRYKWNTGDTTRTILASKSGLYKVEMWTPVCNWRYDSIYITKLYTPTAGINANDTLLCLPFNIKLKAGTDTIQAQYLWNRGDTLPEISTMKAGLFRVNISNPCGALADSVLIKSDSAETIHYSTDTLLCDRDSFVIERNTTSPNTGFRWNDGSNAARKTFKQSGVYWVKIGNSCSSYSDTVKVKFRKKPQPLSPVSFLWCDTLKLYQVISNNSFARITWSTGDTGFKLAIKDTGLLWVQAQTDCGTEKENFTVLRGFSPVVQLRTDTLLCDLNQFTIVPNKLLNSPAVAWNTGANTPTLTVNKAGKYVLSSTNACGTASDSIHIDFLKSPAVSMPPNRQFCGALNGPVVLNAVASGGPANYTWSNGSSGLNTTANAPGIYYLSAQNRCNSVTDSCIVRVFPLPKPDLGTDTAFCGQFSYLLNAGNSWSSVIWSSGQTTQSIFAYDYKTYRVTVTDGNGCTGSDEINIGSNCKLIWYIPDAFTPNADGKNDVFVPVMKDVQDLSISIYDRWGSKIFEGTDNNPGWNGTINGQPAPEGVYSWVASFRSNFKPHYKKGVVTLLR